MEQNINPPSIINYINEENLTTATGRKKIKSEATQLGFKGNPIYNGNYSKTYIKYINKETKNLYNLKSNPIRKGVLTQPAIKREQEGAYYLRQLNTFLQTKEPTTIVLSDNKSLKELIKKGLISNTPIILKFTTINGTQKIYTLNANTATRLQNLLQMNYEENEITSSDSEFYNNFTSDVFKSVELSPPAIKSQSQGSFFKYKHKIKNLNVEDLQIFSINQELDCEMPCCFIQSLISAGVSECVINQAKTLIQTRSIPTCKITQLCLNLKLHITVKNHNPKYRQIHYPSGSSTEAQEIKKLPPIQLGLIDEHYFYIKQVPITRYAIENYEEIKDIDDYHKIYKKNAKGKYEKSNTRFLNSLDFVRLLMEYKHLLEPITLGDEIYKTHYYDKISDIKTLEYSEKTNVRKKIYKQKEDKLDHLNIFADFETTTEKPKHKPYILHIRNTKENIIKTFNGENCGKDCLNYLSKLKRNIRFIFHNAGYDIRFLYKHIMCYEPIERGKFLLRATGRFYTGKTKYYNIQIQDSFALIPEPLRKFSDMFNITIKKEILPYNLYTTENVSKRFIDKKECIDSVKLQYKYNNSSEDICEKKETEFVNEYLKNVDEWCCEDNGMIDIINYSIKYCVMDCKVLEVGYNKFKDNILTITDNKIDIDNYVSVASFSLDYLLLKDVFNGVYELSGVPQTFINKCSYGGRTMCRGNEKYASSDIDEYIDNESSYEPDYNEIDDKILADFDAVSLYPSAMFRLEGFLKGMPKILESLSYETIKNYDGYFIQIIINKVGKHYDFPLMSKVIEKTGIRDWSNNMEGETFYCDKSTLEDLIKYHKIEFTIIRGYYYDEGRNYNLKPVIEHLFNTRLKAKAENNPIEKIYKLIMNSCYGKTLLKPFDTKISYMSENKYMEYVSSKYNWIKEGEFIEEKKEWKITSYEPINNHFNLVSCGVEVLSTSKRIMAEVMCLAEDLNIDMYYTDTDSIHIDNCKIDYLAEEYKEKYNKDLIGKHMGQFHTDFDSDIIIKAIMEKYNLENKTNLKLKDLPKKEQTKYKDSLLAKKSIFMGKKCYIDVIYSVYVDKIDYHIRLKGIPNSCIKYYCYINNLTPLELYSQLLGGKCIKFDLTNNNSKVVFQFNSDMSIETLYEGEMNTTRSVKF